MNKNIIVLLVIACTLLLVRIDASISNDFEKISDMNRNQIENLYSNTDGTGNKFEIALFSGRSDYLASLPNKKNWLTNALFNNKDTMYVNNLVNQTIEYTIPDSLTNKPIKKAATPLHLAIEIAASHRLKSYEARTNKNEVLFNLHDNKYKSMIKNIHFLIDNGALVNTTNSDGKTPLHVACEKAEYKGAMVLLDAHADPTMQDGGGKVAKDFINKKSPMLDRHLKKLTNQLQLTTEAIEAQKLKVINKIVKKGSLTNNNNEIAVTPLPSNKKNASLSQTIYLGNTADLAPSTSSETTASIRSDRRATLTRDNNRQLNLRPEASTASIEDGLFIAKTKTKPTHQRPATASSSRKIAPLNPTASQGKLLINIDNNIEIRQEITRTNSTIKPVNPRPKPTQQVHKEYAQAQTAVKSSILTSQKSTMKVYTAK